jgi:hypothetical protein
MNETLSFWQQVRLILRSRKFWVLLAALAAISAGYTSGEMDGWQAVQALIAALAVYSTCVAIEDAGRKGN